MAHGCGCPGAMATVKALGPEQVLVLLTPFEPVPLYAAPGKRGFAHWTEHRAPDDRSVWFYREPVAPSDAASRTEEIVQADNEQVALDLRGLEPPEPMVRVLKQADTLQPGQRLVVLHDRRPMFLYPQLDARGFVHETEEVEPGLVRIVIQRPADEPP